MSASPNQNNTVARLRAQRNLRIARVDFYLAKTKLVRAMREVEDLMYPPKPGRRQAG